MKRKIMAPMLAAALLLSNGITAFAAPEVIIVDGVNTVFDAEYYAAANPDVAAALGTDRYALVQHYTTFGKNENRPAYAPDTDVDTLLAAGLASSESVFQNDGTTTNSEYDAQGNLVSESVVYSDGTSDTTSYAYDAQGNRVSETTVYSSGFSYTYTYDAQGNRVSDTTVYSDGTSRITDYAYDAQGNCVSETTVNSDGTSDTTSYAYDAQGNLVSWTTVNSDGTSDTYNYF